MDKPINETRMKAMEKARAAKKTGSSAPQTVQHEIRARNGGFVRLSRYGRKMAIKCMCMECLGWEFDPKECPSKLCPLYPFRGRTLASQ